MQARRHGRREDLAHDAGNVGGALRRCLAVEAQAGHVPCVDGRDGEFLEEP